MFLLKFPLKAIKFWIDKTLLFGWTISLQEVVLWNLDIPWSPYYKSGEWSGCWINKILILVSQNSPVWTLYSSRIVCEKWVSCVWLTEHEVSLDREVQLERGFLIWGFKKVREHVIIILVTLIRVTHLADAPHQAQFPVSRSIIKFLLYRHAKQTHFMCVCHCICVFFCLCLF